MPTILPPPRRAPQKRSLVRNIFDVMFNTTLVVSALILVVIVLAREEQYALGHPEYAVQQIDQTAQQARWP